MERIASFQIDHDKLTPGLYISRVDGDCVTYDLRMKTPNRGDYVTPKAIHTLEHLLATALRNSARGGEAVYIGPMGCRTGMYVVFRDSVSPEEALALIREAFAWAAAYTGAIPGATPKECGNAAEHDPEGARQEAEAYLKVLERCSKDTFGYPE